MPENPKSPRDQFVDDLLDASLRQYGRSEPRAGLETRILRRLEEEPPQRSWMTSWHWSAVAVCATVAVVALALITYPPETRVEPGSNRVVPGTDRGGPGTNRVEPGDLARPGAAEQRSSPPQVVVPPPNRTPRFNKTIRESGMRPGTASGIHPGTLPPCRPGEQTGTAATKSTPEKAQQGKSKAPPDCVPQSSEPSRRPVPRN